MSGIDRYQREEHTNWLHAMSELRKAIGACPHDWSDERTTINDIPREQFGAFEDAIRDWAFTYVRLQDVN